MTVADSDTKTTQGGVPAGGVPASPGRHRRVLAADAARASFGKVIDAERSLDVRPVADAVMDAVARHAPFATPKNPLVILMGEDHGMPVHKMAQQLVLKRLLESGNRFAFGYEYRYDLADHVLDTHLRALGVMDHASPDVISFRQNWRGLPALIALGLWKRPYAPEARNNLLAFCNRHKINFGFNDVARNDLTLEMTDALTRRHVRQFSKSGTNISARTHTGMAARNSAIVENVMAHAAMTGSNIYVQHTGGYHLLGHYSAEKAYDLGYSHSLHARFGQAGAKVVPVFISDDFKPSAFFLGHRLHNEAVAGLGDSILVENMCSTIYRDDIDDAVPATALYRMNKRNRLLLNEFISRASGNEIEIFDVQEEEASARRKLMTMLCRFQPFYF